MGGSDIGSATIGPSCASRRRHRCCRNNTLPSHYWGKGYADNKQTRFSCQPPPSPFPGPLFLARRSLGILWQHLLAPLPSPLSRRARYEQRERTRTAPREHPGMSHRESPGRRENRVVMVARSGRRKDGITARSCGGASTHRRRRRC